MKGVLDGKDGKPILFVGDDDDVNSALRRGFTILDACKDGPHSHRGMLGYESLGAPHDKNYLFVERNGRMALNLIDVEDVNFIHLSLIAAGLRFINKHLLKGDRVLVHCNAGKSRSATLALMYLRTIGEMPSAFRTSEKVFKSLYPPYEPSKGIRDFARAHWDALKRMEY
jgi:hypothetical protein